MIKLYGGFCLGSQKPRVRIGCRTYGYSSEQMGDGPGK